MNLGVSLMEQDALLESDPARVAEASAQYREAARLLVERGATGTEAYANVQVNLCDLLIGTGEYAKALETCEEVARRRPDDATAYYNIAAVHALSGRPDEAFAALERDVDLGDSDDRYLETDPWFESLRGDRRFGELLDRMRAQAAPDRGKGST